MNSTKYVFGCVQSKFIPDYVGFVQPWLSPLPDACICIDDFETKFSPKICKDRIMY